MKKGFLFLLIFVLSLLNLSGSSFAAAEAKKEKVSVGTPSIGEVSDIGEASEGGEADDFAAAAELILIKEKISVLRGQLIELIKVVASIEGVSLERLVRPVNMDCSYRRPEEYGDDFIGHLIYCSAFDITTTAEKIMEGIDSNIALLVNEQTKLLTTLARKVDSREFKKRLTAAIYPLEVRYLEKIISVMLNEENLNGRARSDQILFADGALINTAAVYEAICQEFKIPPGLRLKKVNGIIPNILYVRRIGDIKKSSLF